MTDSQHVREQPAFRCRLHKEVERCREAVFRLALVRPSVTFTLFDRGRKAFLLRLFKARAGLGGVVLRAGLQQGCCCCADGPACSLHKHPLLWQGPRTGPLLTLLFATRCRGAACSAA